MVIVGLDLSLRNVGMVAIPEAWDQEWKALDHETFRTSTAGESSRTDTLIAIGTRVVDFCRRTEATHIYCEDYPRHLRSASVHTLAEVGGVVKARVREWTGLDVTPVNLSDARKLLLGRLPKADIAKRVVFEGLISCGAHFEDDHQADAFCVANWGLSELGLWCLSAA